MSTKTAKQLVAEMESLQASLREPVTVWVCNCCGHVAHAVQQPSLVPHRSPITQIECHTPGCNNWMDTVSYRADDLEAAEQATDLYTPVTIEFNQVARFVDAVEFTAKSA